MDTGARQARWLYRESVCNVYEKLKPDTLNRLGRREHKWNRIS